MPSRSIAAASTAERLRLGEAVAEDLDRDLLPGGFDLTDRDQLDVVANGVSSGLARLEEVSEAAVPDALADVERLAGCRVDQQVDVVPVPLHDAGSEPG